ncbi:hypothetical protein B0J13DRAFT_631834 [Dactylonectria estremocensis]|uniref:Uncharacterized protein n=1 Tax=Dactylonectria estremocensis TaxID=1079267 RepID=A0A9P9D2Z5_9HYPO|nr:hypothetical protein B0J13DRAFT_631834 [Dactylonectria estremocensis]
MLNCTIPDGSFTANPDIAGPGVLAAFFFTAAITIIAVVFGYLTGSLDGDFLNDLDYVAIKGAKVLGNKLRRKSPDIEAPEPSPKSNQARKEAIQQFILALSDQQLVTGLALLVCGVLNQESVSVYENSVLLSLAWFSSTTHLATLDALRTHLKTHGVIKHIRVVGMVCVLTLLSYTFCINIIAMDKKSSTVPVQCLFSDTLGDLPGPTGPPDVIPILALLLVFAGYLVRILDLYSEYGPSSYLYATLEYILIHRRPGPNQEYSSLMAEHQAASLVRSLKTIGKFRTKIPKYSKLLEALYAYDASFLSSLQSIAFSFTYGICQVANYRVVLAPDLSAASNYMGFGQMMAVFLLLLPFLSAGETYYGIT